ncbi:MAG: Rieske (2Fe-2S) protein [Bacteroidota bacterium]
MERRNFIKRCGAVGISCLGFSVLLDSCAGVHHVTGVVNNNSVQLSKSEFIVKKDDKISFRKYIIMRVESSNFPIVIYRFSETEFKALLLRCTHQSNELNVNGDLISCSAHGSEFTNKGVVVQGPAEQSLKSFPVTMDENNIYLQLV